ncbi:unnamed protein product [Medioppia subpectinata]|uniref:Glucose-methanol-choline oxidoreductase N-terminal domain-containing protein n=1 Tax=Medioppia subpectinata TaxID=1979941 RepID=A0A7R9KHR6_9ACAR|nr:unnamed protein product [Medioppia subpectinata]CAG2103886.1 unnamed protein product [Medioppia subpectinata]
MITYASILLMLVILKERQLHHNSLIQRQTWNERYDYIVVGAGSSGCVVASRLAEDTNKTVLLIEAGGAQDLASDVPALQKTMFGSSMDWKYPTVFQPHAHKAIIGQKEILIRGKVFGGSSSINSMNYYRETHSYFKIWENLTRVKTWTHNHVFPYFSKSENNLDFRLVANYPELYNMGGPQSINTIAPDVILGRYFKNMQMLGYPINDPDGFKPFGTTMLRQTVMNGVRQSSAVSYLEKLPKDNLHTLGDAQVTRVLINHRKQAIGVEFFRYGNYHKVYANGEVIVSAGAVGSPKILMLSGIGPKDHLQEHNIKVVSDLKVGHNAVSTIGVWLRFDIKNQSLIQKPVENFENFYNYIIHNSGPLAYKGSALTCYPEHSLPGFPDVTQGCALPRTDVLEGDLEKLVQPYKNKDDWREYYRPYLNRSFIACPPVLRRPKATGRIKLASSNPFDTPLIDPCIFCDPQDLKDLVKVFKTTINTYTTPYMKQFIEPYAKPIPGCTPCSDTYFCDSYLTCITEQLAAPVSPMGGNRIGVVGDPNAVVDERLRVFGVSRLRVVDTSIIPVPTEQGNALAVMIAEYASAMIKEDNGDIKSNLNE